MLKGIIEDVRANYMDDLNDGILQLITDLVQNSDSESGVDETTIGDLLTVLLDCFPATD